MWLTAFVLPCIAKSCGRPSEISNGRIVGYVYSFKEKIRYVCFEGFKLKGPSYRICQANEEWSGAKPICEGKSVKGIYIRYVRISF